MKNKVKNLVSYPKGYLEVDETLLRKLGVNPAVLFAAIIQQARTSEEETFQFVATHTIIVAWVNFGHF